MSAVIQTRFPEAYAALQRGDAPLTERIAREHLASEPHSEGALTLLALALQAERRHDEAATVLAQLTRLRPHISPHWNNLGNALRAAGRPADAEHAYRRALDLKPDSALAWLNLGYLALERADFAGARTSLLRTVALAPDSAEARIQAALACYECGDNQAADDLVAGWRTWIGLAAGLRCDLAWVLFLLDHVEDAQAMLQSLAGDPEHGIRARSRLVTVFERGNRLADARAIADALPPPESLGDADLRRDVAGAQAALAARNEDASASRAWFENTLRAAKPGDRSPSLYFALARACDRLGDVDAVMRALAAAHQAQLRHVAPLVPHLLPADVCPLERIAPHLDAAPSWCTDAAFASAPSAETSPIFIVGFPRSGTTMLEQMLDAHPNLRSMDERTHLAELADRIADMPGMRYPDDLGRLDEAACASLRAIYWSRVAETVRLDVGQRLVDKNPLNVLHLPLIRRLFPNARILLALRHPCDVVLSCYMQGFRLPAFVVLCSTLERLARGYANTMRIWDRHAKLLEPTWLSVRYEDVVAEPESALGRVARFIGIDDITPMLAFDAHARRKGHIATPSYSQVVEPLNATAVNRWRRYATHLDPVLPRLRPAMEAFGYDG